MSRDQHALHPPASIGVSASNRRSNRLRREKKNEREREGGKEREREREKARGREREGRRERERERITAKQTADLSLQKSEST